MVMKAISTTAGALRAWPAPGEWTFDDYQALPDEGYCYEVVEGDLLMSPAPGTRHQDVSIRLASAIFRHVSDTNAGKAYAAPCDVMLGWATIVQPDVLFISSGRLDIVGPAYVDGPPDLVVEIISPSDPDHDRVRKHGLYERHGVREYWIVDPAARTIDVFVLEVGGYRQVIHAGAGDVAASNVLAGFQVAVDDIVPAE